MKQLPLQNQSFIYIEKSFREWLDILGYAPSTVYNLPHHLREFLHFLENTGVSHINQIEPLHFKTFYDLLKRRSNKRRGGGLSSGYLNKYLQALQQFATYLRESGKLSLPLLKLNWEEKESEEITYLTQEEIKELYKVTYGYNQGTYLEALNYRDRAMLTVFYGCGLRRNEGYNLDLSDINFERQILHVRKGKNYKERFVPFNKTNLNYLQEYIYDWRPLLIKDSKDGALFVNYRGNRMGAQSMVLRLKILLQRTDNIELQQKEIALHALRHSIATHLLENGMPLDKISRFLGHNSLESTQIYTHLLGMEQAEADSSAEIPIAKRIGKKAQPFLHIPKYTTEQLHEDEL